MSKLDKLIKLKEEYEAAAKKLGKDGVVEYLQEFFTDNPQVKAIQWAQYTPGFNDGDPCVFSVTEPQFSLVDDHDMGAALELGDHEAGFYSRYSLKNSKSKLYKTLQTMEDTFHNLSDLLETAFGNGSQITVHNDGTVEVDDYDCGY